MSHTIQSYFSPVINSYMIIILFIPEYSHSYKRILVWEFEYLIYWYLCSIPIVPHILTINLTGEVVIQDLAFKQNFTLKLGSPHIIYHIGVINSLKCGPPPLPPPTLLEVWLVPMQYISFNSLFNLVDEEKCYHP